MATPTHRKNKYIHSVVLPPSAQIPNIAWDKRVYPSALTREKYTQVPIYLPVFADTQLENLALINKNRRKKMTLRDMILLREGPSPTGLSNVEENNRLLNIIKNEISADFARIAYNENYKVADVIEFANQYRVHVTGMARLLTGTSRGTKAGDLTTAITKYYETIVDRWIDDKKSNLPEKRSKELHSLLNTQKEINDFYDTLSPQGQAILREKFPIMGDLRIFDKQKPFETVPKEGRRVPTLAEYYTLDHREDKVFAKQATDLHMDYIKRRDKLYNLLIKAEDADPTETSEKQLLKREITVPTFTREEMRRAAQVAQSHAYWKAAHQLNAQGRNVAKAFSAAPYRMASFMELNLPGSGIVLTPPRDVTAPIKEQERVSLDTRNIFSNRMLLHMLNLYHTDIETAKTMLTARSRIALTTLLASDQFDFAMAESYGTPIYKSRIMKGAQDLLEDTMKAFTVANNKPSMAGFNLVHDGRGNISYVPIGRDKSARIPNQNMIEYHGSMLLQGFQKHKQRVSEGTVNPNFRIIDEKTGGKDTSEQYNHAPVLGKNQTFNVAAFEADFNTIKAQHQRIVEQVPEGVDVRFDEVGKALDRFNIGEVLLLGDVVTQGIIDLVSPKAEGTVSQVPQEAIVSIGNAIYGLVNDDVRGSEGTRRNLQRQIGQIADEYNLTPSLKDALSIKISNNVVNAINNFDSQPQPVLRRRAPDYSSKRIGVALQETRDTIQREMTAQPPIPTPEPMQKEAPIPQTEPVRKPAPQQTETKSPVPEQEQIPISP